MPKHHAKTRRSVVIVSIAGSLALHGIGLYFLFSHSLSLRSSYSPPLGFGAPKEEVDRAATLRDAFAGAPKGGLGSAITLTSLSQEAHNQEVETPRLDLPFFWPQNSAAEAKAAFVAKKEAEIAYTAPSVPPLEEKGYCGSPRFPKNLDIPADLPVNRGQPDDSIPLRTKDPESENAPPLWKNQPPFLGGGKERSATLPPPFAIQSHTLPSMWPGAATGFEEKAFLRKRPVAFNTPLGPLSSITPDPLIEEKHDTPEVEEGIASLTPPAAAPFVVGEAIATDVPEVKPADSPIAMETKSAETIVGEKWQGKPAPHLSTRGLEGDAMTPIIVEAESDVVASEVATATEEAPYVASPSWQFPHLSSNFSEEMTHIPFTQESGVKTPLYRPDVAVEKRALTPMQSELVIDAPLTWEVEKEELPSNFAHAWSAEAATPVAKEGLIANYTSATLAMGKGIESALPTLLLPTLSRSAPLELERDFGETRYTAGEINAEKRFTQYNLASFPSLVELDTVSLQKEYDCAVNVSSKRPDGTYLFAVTLRARNPERIAPVAQNYTFLIDRSGAIDKQRFKTYCNGVTKALSQLKEGDTFNILLFDSAVHQMSNHSLYYSPSAIKTAKQFLQAQERGFRFASPNISALLLQMGEVATKSPVHNTVFLLTNGKNVSDLTSSRDKNLHELFRKYKGSYTLFTATASQGNEDAVLERLSRAAKGMHIHSQTHAAFPRKLSALVRRAGQVVATNLHASVTKVAEEASVSLFPSNGYLPDLYKNEPLVIYGRTKRLDHFTLLVQGKSGDEWINIREEISLKEADKAKYSLENAFTRHKALNFYDRFLEEGEVSYLSQAQKILGTE